MKNESLIFLFLTSLTVSIPVYPAPIYVNVNADVRNKDIISPQEWFDNFYMSLTDPNDQIEILKTITNISINARSTLVVLEEQKQALLNGGDLHTIANKIIDATHFEANVSNKSRTLLTTATYALMKTVYVIPKEFAAVSLQTRDDWIKMLPMTIEIVKNMGIKAGECLKLIESNQ